MTEAITVALTSSDRFDLLRRTLESFDEHNTYPIRRFIIAEDSGAVIPDDIIRDVQSAPVEVIHNEGRIGQLRSIDRIYGQVRTPWIFHCEDDWEFYRPGFIERSLEILQRDREVITVWLRAHGDTNGHPIEEVDRGGYRYMQLDYCGCWHGFTFNPGLRRTEDCMRLHPYAALSPITPILAGQPALAREGDLSVYFRDLGYRGAIPLEPTGFVRHIGWNRRVPR